MINLKNYILESIFDIEDNIDNMDESIREEIKQFLKENFKNASKYKISEKPNKDGKFEVSSNGDVEVKNKSITSLTNGLFIWANIKGDFVCDECNSLTSLEGAPKEVSGDFVCDECNSLKSLERAPKEVGGNFTCWSCNSLTSLEGAPEKVGGDFNCNYCNSLASLEGAPKKVDGDFSCVYCDSLTSLKGAPKEVGGNFSCRVSYRTFYEEDVKKVSNVKGMIKVW